MYDLKDLVFHEPLNRGETKKERERGKGEEGREQNMEGAKKAEETNKFDESEVEMRGRENPGVHVPQNPCD